MSDGITDARHQTSISERVEYYRLCAKEARSQGDKKTALLYDGRADKLEGDAQQLGAQETEERR